MFFYLLALMKFVPKYYNEIRTTFVKWWQKLMNCMLHLIKQISSDKNNDSVN